MPAKFYEEAQKGLFYTGSCYGCSMLKGDTYSSGHLVPSHLGLAYVLLVKTNLFSRTCSYFSRLCYSNIPLYFLDFALFHVQKLISIYAHCDLGLWFLPFKINRVQPFYMVIMFANFDEEAHNGLVSIVFSRSFPYMSKSHSVANTWARTGTDRTTIASLYPPRHRVARG